MKAHTFLKSILLFLCLLSFIGCKKDEPKDEMQIISMSISEETGITYDLFDTNKEYPIECMLVMEEDAPRVWQPMTFGTIKGFTYEKGHSYELKVKRTRLANPPMDASAYTYELVQILEDRIITEPDEPTDTDKEIHSEADIEYQELCPYEKYAINPEEIRIDKAGNLFDANGSALLPYEDKRIYLENILDKADANWNLFNKIPYMAYYAYVFSPLTDEIRLVRVSGGGPMLKNVIPADEYQELLDRVWGEEVMKYSLIIVNIYKQGLQKVEFTVRLK
ncbi:DUF4377 domain-containing protein [uncultured Phocaeicola sp.]|uniref:DUF4377 domain-containing protein n=1 Tax=uncultured Phocaeicola sp. TaxID=990718 RepID=UPI0025926FAA|nr:DUF4377 domain-containing protein [uncultured Phocaeicola sp.]